MHSSYQHFAHQIEEAEASGDVSLEHLAHDRLNALQETIHNPDLVVDFPAEFTQIVLNDSGYAEFFSKTRGTPLEQQLHMELCATVKASSDLLHRHDDDVQVQALTPIIHQYAAIAANTDNPQAAFCMADVCHSLTNLSEKLADLCNESLAGKMGQAAAEGAIRSAHNYITYAFYNPESVAIDLALGAVHPPAVAFRHLAVLARDVYQNRQELYGAAQQFITDIQQERYRDDEWLEANVSNFTQFFCDMFVTPRVGRRISRCSPVAPLARGFARQKAVVQACAQSGLNAATQKVSSSIKTLLQEAGDAFKTRTLEPAFAGIDRVEKAAPRRSDRLKKIEKAASAQSKTLSIKELADKIRKLDHNVLDEMKKAGGHALEKHVGQTHQELIKRAMSGMVDEAVSSFYDKKTATQAILSTLKCNAEKISSWTKDSTSSKKPKAFKLRGEHNVGISVDAGKRTGVASAKNTIVVLKIDSTADLGFILLTAYPSID